jgi:opacity protein-like surface antigen
MRRSIVFLGSILFLLTLGAMAQEDRHEISVQGTSFFTRQASGNGVVYNATESGGGLATYRYHINHWLSAEAMYGYEVNSQKYLLSSGAFRVQSGIHQATAGLVFNLPSRPGSRFNPYALAGGGALIFQPTGNQINTVSGAQTQAKAAFVYGAGVNYALTNRLSLRAEYRGFVYGSPNLGFSAFSTNSMTHTAFSPPRLSAATGSLSAPVPSAAASRSACAAASGRASQCRKRNWPR